MKPICSRSLLVVVALVFAPLAFARVDLSIAISPYQVAPALVYEPTPYYAPPPVVYFGAGAWGGDRDGRSHGAHRGKEPQRGRDTHDNDKRDKAAKRHD